MQLLTLPKRSNQRSKPWWKSKTMWAAAIAAAVPYIPAVTAHLSPPAGAAIAIVFAILRVVTKEPIGRKNDTAET